MTVASLKEQFIGLLVKGDSVRRAAETVGLDRSTLYDWRNKDEAFRQAWTAAVREVPQKWPPAQDKLLHSLWPVFSFSHEEIARQISAVGPVRTMSAIEGRAHHLGIRRPHMRRGRKVRCACGCRQIVYIGSRRQLNLKHHFVDWKHKTRFERAQRDRSYPDDAPPGSKKREVLDVLRARIAAGTLQIINRVTRNRWARGEWKYLPESLAHIVGVDLNDPQVRELLYSEERRQILGRNVYDHRKDLWEKKPKRRKRSLARQHAKIVGIPNPKSAKATRKRIADLKADPVRWAAYVAQFCANLKTRRRLPSEQIRRSWKRWVNRIQRQGRVPTAQNARRCAQYQARALGLDVEIVLLCINFERRAGRPPDIDLLCAVRDVQRATPKLRWEAITEIVNARLKRSMDADAVERTFRNNRRYLRPYQRPVRDGQPWSPEEKAYVRAHLDQTDARTARALGRSRASVYHFRFSEGIYKRARRRHPVSVSPAASGGSAGPEIRAQA